MSENNEGNNETTISVRMDENGNVLAHRADATVSENIADGKRAGNTMDGSLMTVTGNHIEHVSGGQPDAGKPMSAFESASPLSTMHKKNSSIPANNMQEVAADPENYIMTISGVEGTVQSFISQGLVKIDGAGNITDARTVTDATTPRITDEQLDDSIPYNPLNQQGTDIMNSFSADVGDEIAGQAFVEIMAKTIDAVHELDNGDLAHAEGAKALLKYKPGLGKAGAAKVAKVLVQDFLTKTGDNISSIDPSIDGDAFIDWVSKMNPGARTSAVIAIAYGSTKGLKQVIQAFKMGHRNF